MVSNVKDVPLSDVEAMAGIEEVIAQGHKFMRLDFSAANEKRSMIGAVASGDITAGAYKRNWSFRENALDMVAGKKTGPEIIAEIDAKPYLTAEESGAAKKLKLAEVKEDFTTLDFSFYIADMYRERARADIGLINHGVAFTGNLVRLFAGDIYDSYITPIKPRSFANGSTLIKVSMTGRGLIDALNHPIGYNKTICEGVCAYSGLKCEVAPWNEAGKKFLSVKLADGRPVEEDKIYTVAVWDGSVAEEYILERLESYEGTWEELMSGKLKKDGVISPARDGRIKLVWN